jgi:pyruvate dehydrogenase E1 component alpha subunit
LIEALTYRIEAHTNADDATRYRTSDEVAAWLDRDPVDRLEAYLVSRGLLDNARRAAVAAEAEEFAASVRAKMNADTAPSPDELFEHVYATMPRHLREQAAALREELA